MNSIREDSVPTALKLFFAYCYKYFAPNDAFLCCYSVRFRRNDIFIVIIKRMKMVT